MHRRAMTGAEFSTEESVQAPCTGRASSVQLIAATLTPSDRNLVHSRFQYRAVGTLSYPRTRSRGQAGRRADQGRPDRDSRTLS